MVEVRLKDVVKRYGETVAVNHVDLKVEDGEFYTLLGPSGCGKTTILRIIAGFVKPDQGIIYFGDKDVTYLPPYERNTGMVFQTYALWPHMSVHENVAYGLKLRKVSRKEVERRVKETLEIVGLSGVEKRVPAELSGGQQQRVALARALVIEPEVLLLDEPLSNLDAKLRVQTRTEIRKLQKRLGITSIYVTHDQEEALSISDRVAVMNQGSVQQVGIPKEIYENPLNYFVTDFIGVVNFFKGKLVEIDAEKGIATVNLRNGGVLRAQHTMEQGEKLGVDVLLAVRPETIQIHPPQVKTDAPNTYKGRVKVVSYLGNAVRYEVGLDEVESGILKVDVHNPKDKPVIEEGEEALVVIPLDSLRIVHGLEDVKVGVKP